ncbi:hypothetical protein FGG08_000011 [Glutinoglossum americanum]|uniref:Nucleoside phosphorylase domain-containing protein n=1 Tax=Glutinoglossum americanum TaxID=1670608 RepID=A0A9P8IDM6_9PEZI|nr:hypothetical protein FGG08_000011 [Glutinoglossum americanum]
MPKREFELENNQEAISGKEKKTKTDCDGTQTPPANAFGQGLVLDNYTVGWICAITTEYVAARAFLDEKHEGPESVSLNDNNDYTLGKFGKHNVVIAVLPEGEYGISSAVGVARDMLHSFPNIRIGLMVGIGGGAPSPKHDIRLGDIVVSAPRDGKGGVFQYDFGKTIQDQSFRPTGFLDQPPRILRTTVNGLKARYESEGHQFEEAINGILGKNSRLRKKYQRPESSKDRLYQTGVTHPSDDEVSCAAVCGDNPLNLIPRHKRAEDEDNPAIHYGLIASANQLMKDALLRDKFAKENGVLCFEMEAAGLMNQFPCLVIRGICDYSDTHNNKEWQGYAAMAAAAYAKDLLCRIPPNRVEAEKNIIDILSGQSEAGIQEGVGKLLHVQHDYEHGTILDWLTPIDYSPLQSDFLSRHKEGTGQWLLNSKEFQTWLSTAKQTLFCPGIPGAGKTIMTSIVVDYLSTKFENDINVSIAFLYCNFQRHQEQKLADLLASLLKQLVQQRPSIPKNVKSLYEHHREKRTRPLFDEILKELDSVVRLYSKVFIIIDALDEYQALGDDRRSFLRSIFNLQAQAHVNIFTTSRFIPEIEYQFEKFKRIEIRAQHGDILRYLNGRIPQLLRSRISEYRDLQDLIRKEVTKAADGMFLLAQLHMDSLMGKPTAGDIKLALWDLPKGMRGLDMTYEQAIKRINGQEEGFRELAKRVLSWLIHAKRQLTVTELQHALAVRNGMKELDKDFIPEVGVLLSICAGLVIVGENSIIRLVHYTTQEYFERTWAFWFPNAQMDITSVCVTYLSFDVFETGFCQSDREFEARLQTNVLYDYAARNWGHHACVASIEEGSIEKDLILNFLRSRAKVSAASQAMMTSGSYSDYSQRVLRQITGIHVAAYFGLAGAIMGLLKNGYNPYLRDSYGQTPLSQAAERGHEAVVKLLLERGAELESKSNSGQTPLSRAAERGHEAVVKLLLERGAELESKSNSGQTPLSRAAERGHEAVVKLLLERGAELESKSNSGQTPLSWAAERGHEAIVKLLLERGAQLEAKDDEYGQTPLSWVAGRGCEAAVKLLLERGAQIESKSNSGQTPLSWAAERGHEAVVKLLLERGAELESKSNSGQTPLSRVAERGCEAAVKLLLERGAQLESKSNSGQTPLSWAAERGHEAVVKLLLKRRAELESKDDEYGQTPLSWAAQRGHESVVKLLLERGAELESKDDEYGQTPLSWAANRGHKAIAIVKLLLERSAQLESKDDAYGQTPLSWAANRGHKAIVKLLLERGAELGSKDTYGRTPLSWAAERGHEAVVKLLLERGAELESKDTYGRTPLSWAAQWGREAVVKLLIERGAEKSSLTWL